MTLVSYLIGILLCHFVHSLDSDSIESFNGIEVSPFYDAIIFSDIADIINEFEANNIQISSLAKNESDSDEDIDSLLSEYQRYLEKAHKQTKDFIEKSRLKNKVPLVRHERYFKPSFINNDGKYTDMYYKSGYYNPEKSPIKYTQTYNPLDLFLPFNPKGKHILTRKDDQQTFPNIENFDLNTFKKVVLTEEKQVPDFQKHLPKPGCFCKTNHWPCSCGCKQCFMPMSSLNQNDATFRIFNEDRNTDANDITSFKALQRQNVIGNKPSFPDDVLNIRIKVDVQLPNLLDRKLTQNGNYARIDSDKTNSNEYLSSIKMPTPYYNFPIPMNMFGYKRNSIESAPLHKITIHKKKKPKMNNGNKKHRKKVITFHNIKIEPQQLFEAHFGKINMSSDTKNEKNYNSIFNFTTSLKASNSFVTDNKYSTEKNTDTTNINETQTEDNVFLLVNISHNILNMTDENSKIGNSAEVEYSNTILNTTTDKSVHSLRKREIASITKHVSLITTEKPYKTKLADKKDLVKITTEKNVLKKNDKNILSDTELLYWPKTNNSVNYLVTKNITTIILENEHKKSKINLTNEVNRKNHTSVLEKVIFGDVDWNDVSTVAPAFISFVGKYLEGVLTFCSETDCHSMKCEKKNCLYRVCNPNDRINNKGHCTGSNNTESVTSMESIMDLPSNVAFELVDILQERMSGKLYGKVTICINAKCITLTASKKLFFKVKCAMKELNHKGHCVGLSKTSL